MTEPLPAASPPGYLPAHPVDPAIQAALDADHLKLLEIGFYISGVMTAVRFLWFLAMAVFFAVIGFSAMFASLQSRTGSSNGPPPALFFTIFACFFGAMILFSLIFAALEIYAGRCLKQRGHPILIQVVAAFYCLSIPWGTALGVFTFMVLNRPSVKALFEQV